jgi:pimeloyl-ACP methyl ester carboxylesterase
MDTKTAGTQSPQAGSTMVDGHSLYWERYGQPEKGMLTLLHHGLGSVISWQRQIPALCEAGWEVLAYDRWGYGRSEPRPEFDEHFLRNAAHAAFDLIDLLGIDRTALIGHSEGGTIALWMAALKPERITALVLIAAHIYYEEKMSTGMRSIAEQVRVPPLSDALKREHGNRAQALADMWIQHWLKSDTSQLEMSNVLDDISCPTLVIQGELDEHATPQHAMDIADGVRNGELWMIPGVGHMPPHEIPDEFNSRVLEFLDRARLNLLTEEEDV